MLGSSIMVAPVVHEAALERYVVLQCRYLRKIEANDRRDVYFPTTARWYDLWSGLPISVTDEGWVRFEGVGISDTFSFLRGGSILALQEPALTVAELVQQPLSWVVALDSSSNSTGALFLDDGVSVEGLQSKWEFLAVPHSEGHAFGKMYVDKVMDDYEVDEQLYWTSISVYGIEGPCDLAIVSTAEWEYYFWPESGLEYDEDTLVLRVTGLNVSLSEPHVEITWGKSTEPPSWTFRIAVIVCMTVVVVAFLCLVAVSWHFGTKYLPETSLYKRFVGRSTHSYTAAGAEDDAEADTELFAIDDCYEDGEEMHEMGDQGDQGNQDHPE